MVQSKFRKLKWVVYALLLLLFYVLQTTPLLFQIRGIKPVLIVPYVICIALFENEAAAAAFGVAAGLLWDISGNTIFGYKAILLMCCCIAVSLLVMYLMRNNLLNALFFIFAIMLLEELLTFFLYYVLWGYENSYIILLKYTLPTICYTIIMMIPIYFVTKSVAKKFNETLRM